MDENDIRGCDNELLWEINDRLIRIERAGRISRTVKLIFLLLLIAAIAFAAVRLAPVIYEIKEMFTEFQELEQQLGGIADAVDELGIDRIKEFAENVQSIDMDVLNSAVSSIGSVLDKFSSFGNLFK